MSNYYRIKGYKVRVSDHEPNRSMDKFRGSNDIEIYTHDAVGEKINIQGQIEKILDEYQDLKESDFEEIIQDNEAPEFLILYYDEDDNEVDRETYKCLPGQGDNEAKKFADKKLMTDMDLATHFEIYTK